MDRPKHVTPRHPLERLTEALLAVAVSACTVGGYLALRALAWRQDHLVVNMLMSGAVLTAIVSGIIGAAYLLFGRRLVRAIGIDWMSARLGAFVGAIVYALYHMIAPLTAAYETEPLLQRAIQGGLDGALIGAGLGLLTAFVSGRRLHFNDAGLVRFLLLYTVILLIAGVIVLVDGLLRLPAITVVILSLPSVVVLRVAVAAIDRRIDAAQTRDSTDWIDAGG